MRLLDLFCGAGGAAQGYKQAGFHVTGVDHQPQPRYRGDVFVQADALTYLAAHGDRYDVIHASPPCQGYSRLRHLPWIAGKVYPLLIPQVRAACQALRKPYLIENVEDAPLDPSFVLCGQMFTLSLYRHRRFESSHVFLLPDHQPHRVVICAGRSVLAHRYRQARSHKVTGVVGGVSAQEAMGIDWMSLAELRQAIPPAYTFWIGTHLIAMLRTKE